MVSDPFDCSKVPNRLLYIPKTSHQNYGRKLRIEYFRKHSKVKTAD